uniref:Uncharacterized protein n=1 Tax=Arundo donax TaxID=35708 RepID=A0A0A8YUN0_ARUDO
MMNGVNCHLSTD